MSGDIVERLRHVAWLAEEGSEVVDLATTAADEIVRLRKRLQTCQSNDDYPLTDDCITQNERFLLEEVERLRAALRYIERPTMSLGGADPEQHVLVADERAVRLALQACIRMAREALAVEARRG